MTKTKRPTLIVREVMRKYGKSMIWTNKHRTMRSVKCFASDQKQDNDLRMVKAIGCALKRIGVKKVGVNYTYYDPMMGYGPRDSIIIQLPL